MLGYYDYYYLFLYFWRQEFCYLYLGIYGICFKFIGHSNFAYSPCLNIFLNNDFRAIYYTILESAFVMYLYTKFNIPRDYH